MVNLAKVVHSSGLNRGEKNKQKLVCEIQNYGCSVFTDIKKHTLSFRRRDSQTCINVRVGKEEDKKRF